MESDFEVPALETDVLIIGAGPAGASLACFLASHGVQGLMISASSSTSATPRAHYTNMAALECLRDIGLEGECAKVGTPLSVLRYDRWCNSLAGEEYARTIFRANEPHRRGDYYSASPCSAMDLPQTELEPILIGYASRNGFKCRFDTRYLEHDQDAEKGTVTTTVFDGITNQKYRIKSRYLAGADGANSLVVEHLDLPLQSRPAGAIAVNVLVDADLSHQMENCEGVLHSILQPDKEWHGRARFCIARMVKPWHEWLFIFMAAPNVTELVATNENWLELVKESIDDDSVDVKVKRVSPWTMNDTVAELYQKGNVFCLGDAVHRHPPFNGLGSNTCIQDAYNLAWKIAYVLQGKASPALLDTYTLERQPVGAQVVRRANESKDLHSSISVALGINDPDLEQRMKSLREMGAATEAGRTRRKAFQESIEEVHQYERCALGTEMNQSYDSSPAIVTDDETEAAPKYIRHPDLYYMESTYPGRRLPHAWLNKQPRQKQAPISTQDLAGKGGFTLLTGTGRQESWTEVAVQVSAQVGVEIKVYCIGWRQEFDDVFFDWERKREIGDDGCLLVRPDRFICWRRQRYSEDCGKRLTEVMRTVLGLDRERNE